MKWGAGDVMWSIDWGSLCDCTLWTGVIERTNWKIQKMATGVLSTQKLGM